MRKNWPNRSVKTEKNPRLQCFLVNKIHQLPFPLEYLYSFGTYVASLVTPARRRLKVASN